MDLFDLSIFESTDPTVAIAVARHRHDMAIEQLDCGQLQRLHEFRTRLVVAAGGKGNRPAAQELLEFGKQLFAFTMAGRIRRIYDGLPPQHVRLHTYSNRADLQALPWEYLQQPDTVPGPNSLRSVVRIVPTIGLEAPEPYKPEDIIRMLFVYADPINQSGVDWPIIKATVENEFQTWLPQRFRIDVVEGATRRALLDALQSEQYDILHFAGHGQIDSEPDPADPTKQREVGKLVLVNLETGESDPVPAAQLGMILRNRNLRLVFLSACSSATGDFAKEYTVVAKTLVECGVPVVVANQFPITNSIAARFAGAFYKHLLKTGDVDEACTEGRVELAFDGDLPKGAARFEWGIPTLYRHVAANRIFHR